MVVDFQTLVVRIGTDRKFEDRRGKRVEKNAMFGFVIFHPKIRVSLILCEFSIHGVAERLPPNALRFVVIF